MQTMDKVGNFLSGVLQWIFVVLILIAMFNISPCTIPFVIGLMIVVAIALRKR